MRAGHGGETNRSVPGKVLHWVGGRMQALQFRRFDFEAWLHPFHPHLPLAELPLSELALAHVGVGVIQAGHVVGQEGVCGIERNEEGMVAVGGGHDVGPGVFPERVQGGRVGANVWWHGGDGGGGRIEGCSHVSRTCHLRISHATLMGRTGRFSSSLRFLFSLPLPISFLLPFPFFLFLLSCFLLSLPLGFLQRLLSFLCQFR